MRVDALSPTPVVSLRRDKFHLNATVSEPHLRHGADERREEVRLAGMLLTLILMSMNAHVNTMAIMAANKNEDSSIDPAKCVFFTICPYSMNTV